nr:unnamed protein product [Callosobruchus analis]
MPRRRGAAVSSRRFLWNRSGIATASPGLQYWFVSCLVHTCSKFSYTMDSEENLVVELFIDTIKNYPEIWNIASEMYHDRVKKRSNKFIRKWRNIKDSYLKNLKKKTKSGQAANFGRTYIYAKQLSFLQQAATTSETQSSLLEEQQVDDVPSESSELAEGRPSPSHRPSDVQQGRKNKAVPQTANYQPMYPDAPSTISDSFSPNI